MTAVERFAAHHFTYNSVTPARQREVLRYLGRLEAHAGAPAETLTYQELEAFLAYQLQQGYHVNTVLLMLKAIKPFYRWAWRNGVIDAERWLRIKEVPPPRGSTAQARPRPYKREQIERFWQQLDERFPLVPDLTIRKFTQGIAKYRRVWRHATHLQIQAIAGLALLGGLRQTEILLADVDDIHPDNAYIVVDHGKSPFGHGNGHREVPYTEQGREMVGRWLELRDVLSPPHDRPWLVLDPRASQRNRLAPSDPMNPLHPYGMATLLPKVGKGWELHRFRHTCATEWLRAGVELERVSKLLGHSHIQQTLCYTELVRDDLADSMRAKEEAFVTAVGRRHKLLINQPGTAGR